MRKLLLATESRPWSGQWSVIGWSTAASIGTVSLLCLAAGLIDLTSTGSVTARLLLLGGVGGFFSALLAANVKHPVRISKADIWLGTTIGYLLGIFFLTFVFIVTGVSNSFDDAIFEATAGLTTTAFSVFDATRMDRGVLFLRSASQWLGGFAALVIAIVLIPFYGSGGEFADKSTRDERVPLAPNQRSALKNVLAIYCLLCLALWVAYSWTGIGVFDGLLMAFSTVSTGGYVASKEVISTPAVQWVAIVGMLFAGTSIVIIWRLFVGHGRGLLQSKQLRSYAVLVFLATVLFLLWTDGFHGENIRYGLFTVISAITTTGFSVNSIVNWSFGVTGLLLLLVAIGPMTGSTGGGFQILRLRLLFSIAVRELVRQIHPRAIMRVRVGERVANEETIRLVTVVQFVFVAVLFCTATMVAVLGVNVLESLSASIHALATAGPVRGSQGEIVDISNWSRSARLSLLPAMIFGRLYIYPVAVAFGIAITWLRDSLRLRRRWRRWRAKALL